MNKNTFDPTLSDEDQFMQAIMLLGKHIFTHMEAALDETGVSLPKLHALKELNEAGAPLGVGDLARCIRTGRSNATQLVDRMEAENLVERIQNPDDRRGVLVRMTPEGEARFAAGEVVRRQVVREMMNRLTPDERRFFIALARRLLDQ